jgi:hypothetical protein
MTTEQGSVGGLSDVSWGVTVAGIAACAHSSSAQLVEAHGRAGGEHERSGAVHGTGAHQGAHGVVDPIAFCELVRPIRHLAPQLGDGQVSGIGVERDGQDRLLDLLVVIAAVHRLAGGFTTHRRLVAGSDGAGSYPRDSVAPLAEDLGSTRE